MYLFGNTGAIINDLNNDLIIFIAVCAALLGKKKVGVIDRNISIGSGGIFCQELRGALLGISPQPIIYSYIAGVGGTDVDVEIIHKVALNVMKRTDPKEEAIWVMEDF